MLEKKYPTKDVDKGTDELADVKKAVVTIHRKGLDKFEGQSKGYIGWFKLDSEFFFKLKLIRNSIRTFFEKEIEGQDIEVYKKISSCLINNLSRQKM